MGIVLRGQDDVHIIQKSSAVNSRILEYGKVFDECLRSLTT